MPCTAEDVLNRTAIQQRFELRQQPDYQQSEFLVPPPNAQFPPGLNINIKPPVVTVNSPSETDSEFNHVEVINNKSVRHFC